MNSASYGTKISSPNPLGAEIFAFKVWNLTLSFPKIWGDPHPHILYFSKGPMETYNPLNFGFPTYRNVWDMWQNIKKLTFKPKFAKIGGTPSPKFYIFRKLQWRSTIPESLVFLSPEMSEICGKTFLAIVPNVKYKNTETWKAELCYCVGYSHTDLSPTIHLSLLPLLICPPFCNGINRSHVRMICFWPGDRPTWWCLIMGLPNVGLRCMI